MGDWSLMKKSICGAAAVLAMIATLLGFTWAMDQHWTTREVHDMFAASIYEQFQKMDKRNDLRDAQRDVQYWLKMEMFWKVECAKNPNDQDARKNLNNAIQQRMEAERRQRNLQGQ